MDINPIKTKADHVAALKEIESLMGAKANSADGERLNTIATLVEAYEQKHSSIEPPKQAKATNRGLR
jgi:HTH-type transcriptional regulator/antitoxin HigA